jgi:prevent-host-death family protein
MHDGRRAQVNVAEAEAKLSALIDRAAAGEEIVLAKAGKPVARITAMPRKEPRQPGPCRH